MTQNLILFDIDQRGVAKITFNRPDAHNAFDGEFVSSLFKVITTIENNQKVRVVVIAAEGKSFCAGADIKWMKRMGMASEKDNKEDAESLANLLEALDNLSKPTISLVQGGTLGGGVGLVAATDIAIAVETAFFAISEVRVGVIPSVISPFVINKIGESYARRYFLTGERFSADQACQIGLVQDVVRNDDLYIKAEEYIHLLMQGGPKAQREAKMLVRLSRGRVFDPELKEELAQRIARVRVSEEGQEGLLAFQEKRKADWN
ncbi:MAG: hypothetical protein CMM30_05625 [Rhodospirillaceae bacterium]|nr:hypothetical protein [Rhodospirillaceae bacterium]|tara:strand:- start:2822 stop:3607 length:786 start_codon:yes stop_codon:yes gene_type:complete